MASPRRIVIALGGNALMSPGGKQDVSEEMKKLGFASGQIARIAGKKGVQIAITHGNGTQAGDELIKNAAASSKVPGLPLGLITAETQASIGSMIELAMNTTAGIEKTRFTTIITHVLVNGRDKAFSHPTKPIGPSFTAKQIRAEAIAKRYRYSRIGNGFRIVVPSPRPIAILEIESIKEMLKKGGVICCGGGGIPITASRGKYSIENAVLDKDYTSSLLARLIGADMLVILTDVDYAYRDFPKNKVPIRRISAEEIMESINSFAEGSMRPKLEACATFAASGTGIGVIGSLKNMDRIMRLESGTIITK